MNDPEKTIWFPAMLYGWGWGFPIVWQGWLVFLGYLILLIGGSRILLPDRPSVFYSLVTVLTVALVAICWLKGEKPRWRWGRD